MTPQEAQKRIRKILGPQAAWREEARKTSPEARQRANEEYKAVTAQMESAKAAMAARREALLSTDTEYRAHRAAYQSALERQKRVRGGGYRVTVGLDMGFAFEVRAEGDSWSEVVRALETAPRGQLTVARVS